MEDLLFRHCYNHIMSGKTSQTQVRILIFLLSVTPFYHTDLLVENYTGILNHGNRLLFWICIIPLFSMLTWLAWKKIPFSIPRDTWKKRVFLADALLLITMLFPYPQYAAWSSQMHILMGTITWGYMHFLILLWIKNDIHMQYFYKLMLFLTLLLIVSAGCINGLAELVAVNTFSFLVTH